MTSRDRPALIAFAGLAALLLAATEAWMIPMMLWDHLDLLPMVDALDRGDLAGSGFWSVHGGHLHTAAYAVLLATTTLADGRPWLDGLVSWALLVTTAGLLMAMALRTVPDAHGRQRWLLAMVVLALFPGHIANLQWGWQVAVFLCLLGAVLAIRQLAAAALQWRGNLVALAAAALALLSFATALAIVPTAVVLVALRAELAARQRLLLALPWLALGLLAIWPHLAADSGAGSEGRSLSGLTLYTLNFLGAGIARYATDLAPVLALASLPVALWLALRHPHPGAARPWLGLLLFGVFAAFVVALGRAAPFGGDQAFATRYVSFSSLYWLGWIGLLATSATSATGGAARPRRWPAVAATVVLVLALANGLHMLRKGARLAAQTAATAAELRATWPDVREDLLSEIYFDQPGVARVRLENLQRRRWPPFDGEADAP